MAGTPGRAKTAVKTEHHVNTWGVRRRYGGKMGVPVGRPNKRKIVPRSNGASKGTAPVTYECGQDKTYNTGTIPGKFKRSMPRGCVRYCRPTHLIGA